MSKNKNYLNGTKLTFEEIMTGEPKMKNIKFKKEKNKDLYNLISQRLSMQSVKNEISKELGVYIDNAAQIITPGFINGFFTWDKDKQNKLLRIISGIYSSDTRKYFVFLHQEYNNIVWQTANVE